MLPQDLKTESFAGYPPEARKFVANYVGILRLLPLSFVPELLRELIDYDFAFPAERSAHEKELEYLSSLPGARLRECFETFAGIRLSPQLENSDWVKAPAHFVEQLSEYLWSTHQLDTFRKASNEYADRIRAANPPEPPKIPRLSIAIIGQGVTEYNGQLFRKLRAHGAYYSGVKPDDGLRILLDAAGARAKAHPVPYGHWYIDGGEEADHTSGLTCVSYRGLEPVRTALLRRMQAELDRPGMGPEALRTFLAQLRPSDIEMGRLAAGQSKDELLQRFELKLLTEGSGTQIFSTVFAQWAAREVLRRAQPLTLLVRFAPRQRQKPMNELLSANATHPEMDLVGSLIDGDMGAYYNWLNQQRLPGAEESSFLVWFEGHNQAVAIGPATPRGTESKSPANLAQVLEWTT